MNYIKNICRMLQYSCILFNRANDIKFLLCRMAEDDIIQNLDTGGEYTGFEEIVKIIPRNSISEKGIPYDIDASDECGHIIKFIDDVKKERNPKLNITCGSFFSRNGQLQNKISGQLNSLAKLSIPIAVIAGGKDVGNFFEASVFFKFYDRHTTHIPHFMVTNDRFLLELPHTEKSQIRVDIISDTFDQQIKEKILNYLNSIIEDLNNKV